MGIAIYWIATAVLVPTSILLAGHRLFIRLLRRLAGWERVDEEGHCKQDEEAHRLRRIFLQVYLLVMSSEWLQGPYMYTLLHDEKSLSEAAVASLYATAYVAAAISALFTGFLADRFGRRAACLVFCLLHSCSCLTLMSSSLAVIFIGRLLAGISLTLLWTVFESWMVTEFNARGLSESSTTLGEMFSIMTTSNCTAAIVGGVLSHCLVLALGSNIHPFLLGIVLESAAAYLMLRDWNENYGLATAEGNIGDGGVLGTRRGPLGDIRVWMLSSISCFFEGTNFLVLFFWPSMLQDADRRDKSDEEAAVVPYGVIFATFMSTMILGALLFNTLIRDSNVTTISKLRGAVAANWLLAAAIFLAAASLIMLSVLESEVGIFGSFLLFETCNGAYLPSIAYQRGLIVVDSDRTRIYGLLKIPLFIFVIWTLDMTATDDSHRRLALLVSAGFLLMAAVCAACLRTGAETHHTCRSTVDMDDSQDLLSTGKETLRCCQDSPHVETP